MEALPAFTISSSTALGFATRATVTPFGSQRHSGSGSRKKSLYHRSIQESCQLIPPVLSPLSPLDFVQDTNHSGQLPSLLFSCPQCALCFLSHSCVPPPLLPFLRIFSSKTSGNAIYIAKQTTSASSTVSLNTPFSH